MKNDLQQSPHVYTVELRFSGVNLKPAEISKRLDLRATVESQAANNRNSGRVRLPFWGYDGEGAYGYQSEWDNLEEGLLFLMGCLRHRKREISDIAREYHAVWWCGHFQASFDGGPTLSPEMLTELASFRIPLAIDNYFSDV